MLVIRPEQIKALSRVTLAPFAQMLAQHVAGDFPEQGAVLTPEEIRQAVDYGIEKGLRYGLDEQKDLATFVYLMFTLGRDFDQDPGYPWAAAHLKEVRKDQTAFARLLRVAGQFEHVGGGLQSRTGKPRPN